MCRILILLGNNDYNIIYKFLEQSIKPKNTPNIQSKRDADYHLDGFGFAYYDKKWNIYKNHLLFNKDKNLDNVIKSINSNVIIGHIRAMCNKSNSFPKYENTHPFIFNNNIWCHNGCICNFDNIKNDFLINKYKKYIKGKTDSEYLFYYFLSILDTKKDTILNNLIETSIIFFNKLKSYNTPISANIVYANNDYILVSRFINNDEIPASLYYTINNNKCIISSEPLNEQYNIFPSKTLWIIDKKTFNLLVKINL